MDDGSVDADEEASRRDVRAALAGDEDAARRLVERHTPLVAAIARAHRPRSLSVDDLVQESFMRMFARLDRYAPWPGAAFAAWLARLAANVCRDVLRGEAARPRLELGPEAEAALRELVDGGVARAPEAAAARELVDALLAELPPADRAVLTLLDLRGLGSEEAARLLGIGRGALKVRAFRARRRLAEVARRRRAAP